MTDWLITQKPTFLSELLALPPKESHQVQEKLSLLVQDPTPDGKVKKQLKNWTPPVYRLRCGNYRIFYAFNRPYVSLLALRRRSEDTYDDHIEAEDLGGFAPVIQSRRPAHDSNWTNMLLEQPKTSLPTLIDKQLLRRLRIPEQYHQKLLQVSTQEDLLSCIGVPDELLLQIDEVMFERSIDDVLQQVDLVAKGVDELFRFKEGDLTGFLLKLSPEQEHLVTLNIDDTTPTLVKGGAGSGKSTVALYRAAALAHRMALDGKGRSPILFTTYTNALVSFSRGLLRALLNNKTDLVEVATADSVIARILVDAGVSFHPASQKQLLDAVRQARQVGGIGGNALERMRSKSRVDHIADDYLVEEITSFIDGREVTSLDNYLTHARTGREEPLDAEQRQIVWLIKRAFDRRLKEQGVQSWSMLRVHAANVARAHILKYKYNAIIIDEAQDLEPAALNALTALLANAGRIFLTADANQSIYGSSFRWSEVHQQLVSSGAVGVLSANFRSTREIAFAAKSYLDGAAIDLDSVEQRFVHEGPVPTMRTVRTLEDEAALLERFIRGASRELRLTIGSTAILCPSAREGERIAESLAARGLAATFMLSKDLDVYARGVKVLPLRSAKGLEFPIVAIAGLWPPYPYFPANAGRGEQAERISLERRTLYVGMTRAMRALLVVVPQTTTSSLLSTFDGSLWNMAST